MHAVDTHAQKARHKLGNTLPPPEVAFTGGLFAAPSPASWHRGVLAQAFVEAGVAAVQLLSAAAMLPSLPSQVTLRVCIDSAVPQVPGQSGNAAATQELIIGHISVASQVFTSAGFGSLQLASSTATAPVLHIHGTARVCTDCAEPQSVGQGGNSDPSHA